MRKIGIETVLAQVPRYSLDGKHVCSPDLRLAVCCPMLSVLRCSVLHGERVGFDGFTVLPHVQCPLSAAEVVEG